MANDTPDIAKVSDKNTTGEIDPSKWEEAVAVTGRPNDEPEPNTTFGDRAKVRSKPSSKPVDVKPAKKSTRKGK